MEVFGLAKTRKEVVFFFITKMAIQEQMFILKVNAAKEFGYVVCLTD